MRWLKVLYRPVATDMIKLILILSGLLIVTFSCNRVKKAGDSSAPVRFPKHFGSGKKAPPALIAAWDKDVRPDGKGLPPGSGTYQAGRKLYEIKCQACHGKEGRGGASPALTGPEGDTAKAKTIGNYWPYASTVFDYIQRAMPFNAPGSLESQELYDLTAYLLTTNKIIDSLTVVDSSLIAHIIMPAKKRYVSDNRHGGHEVR